MFLATKRKKIVIVMAKKPISTWAKVKQIFWRMIATFTANGLATVGAGSIIGIEILDAILLAGTLGVVKVSEDLARAFLDDGKITLDEINEVFGKLDRRK